MAHPKRIPQCPGCGSEDILLDALCRYDPDQGIWMHDCDDDKTFCQQCEQTFDYDDLVWISID